MNVYVSSSTAKCLTIDPQRTYDVGSLVRLYVGRTPQLERWMWSAMDPNDSPERIAKVQKHDLLLCVSQSYIDHRGWRGLYVFSDGRLGWSWVDWFEEVW